MGILSALRLVKDEPDTLKNQYAPAIMASPYGSSYWGNNAIGPMDVAIDLVQSLQVPTVAKIRNSICGVIGGIPLELFKKSTGEHLPTPTFLDQPDIRQPRSVTISYLVESLIFFGVGYLEVTSVNKEDGRPNRFAWVQNSRVTAKLNQYSTEVDFYMVNNEKRPMSGQGSLVTFQSLQPPVLTTGARTIRAALDLEYAASVAASTPLPTSVLKNSGPDLPESVVSGLLANWKQARQNRSTAYLTSTLELQTFGFSPKDMMYQEAKQGLSTEICRLMNFPAYMASSDANSSYTYSNILDARKEYFAYTLAPYVCAIEDRFSMDDLTGRGTYVRMAVDETFLRVDAMTRLNTIEKMLGLGLITLDQAMSMEDLSPNGDAS